VVCLVVYGSFAVGFVYVFWIGVGGLLQLLGLGLVSYLLWDISIGYLKDRKTVAIVPVYEKLMPEAGTYLSGHAIARNCLQLDQLAKLQGLKPISAFGFNDPLRGETLVWHDPIDGFQTVAGLIRAVATKRDAVDDPSSVISDLEKIRSALEQARGKGIRFAFLVEIGKTTSARVWRIRQAFA
jgi:hypothetical protein